MKHIIFLFLITTILYINAGDHFPPNNQRLQQENVQTHLNKKLKTAQYNQQSEFNKNNTRAQFKQTNQKSTKFTGRRSHPR